MRCRSGEVLVEEAGLRVATMPIEQVERVLVLGGVGLSTGFLDLAFGRRIPVTFLTREGSYKGRLDPGGLRDVALSLSQHTALGALDRRLFAARALVVAKLAGQRALLLRSARNHAAPSLRDAAAQLLRLSARAETDATTLPELMGLEGAAARVYFGALPQALRRPFPLKGRSRRPPRDAGNALLSLGYGLLTAEILGALAGVGLDPRLGFFHSPRGRMPALAQDVIECFRAPVSDALMLALVNRGVLQESDFEPTESGGIALKKPALTTYFKHFRRRMSATFQNRQGQPSSFRHEVHAICAHLRHVYLDDHTFQPFVWQQGGPSRYAEVRANRPASVLDQGQKR